MNETQIPRAGRKALHPTLLAMARELQALEFASPLTEEENAHLKANALRPPKNYSVLPRAGQVYTMVRMSFLGKNTTLGLLTGSGPDSRAKASRFADMCRAKFWPYKLRDRRPPAVEDLNLSPARAEMDLKNETAAVDLLNRIERFLLGAGMIKLVEIKAANKERKQQTRAELVTLNKSLTENNVMIKQVLNTLENRLDGLQQVVMGIQKDNSVLIMAVSTILEKLANPPLVGVWSGQGITYPGATGNPMPPTPQNTCCNSVTEVRSLPSNKYEP